MICWTFERGADTVIKDEIRRDELLRSFPDITAADEDEIYRNLVPHVVFYRTAGRNRKECVCTRCRGVWEAQGTEARGIGHNVHAVCPKCGGDITFRSPGMGNGVLCGRKNACVMLVQDGALWIREYSVKYTFHNIIGGIFGEWDEILPEIDLDERHRYYISAGHGAQHWQRRWHMGKEVFRTVKSENEPVFNQNPINYNTFSDNSYLLVNPDAWREALPYAELDAFYEAGGRRPIQYLSLYAKHPNAEYLMKTGYGNLLVEITERESRLRINWRTNDVRRMLGLNSEEFGALAGEPGGYIRLYKTAREMLPGKPPERLAAVVNAFGRELTDSVKSIRETTGLPYAAIVKYCEKQSGADRHHERAGMTARDWKDYLSECRTLGYDLKERTVIMPRSLRDAHERTSGLVRDMTQKEIAAKLRRKMRERRKSLEARNFPYTDRELGLMTVLPGSVQDVVNEGKALNHCVAGYAARHADGALTIWFIRRICKPEIPYYTAEVSEAGRIIQCRGYRNNNAGNPKPDIIREFERRFQARLDAARRAEEKRKRSAKKSETRKEPKTA
jgi:hypothetical protein